MKNEIKQNKTTQRRLIGYVAGFALFCCVFLVTDALAQSVCDPQFVVTQPNLNRVTIDSNGIDDTDNVQCGFNLAIERNIAEIHLRDTEYFLGSVIATGYQGTIRGSGMNRTTLRALPERIDCESFDRKPALIKISGGEVVLKWLSVEGSSPCTNVTFLAPSMSLIHFTGKNRSDASCKPDVIKGEVDRVRVTALGGEHIAGISASPEETEPNTCNDLLLGLFRLNRSSVLNADFGLHVWMRGGAQVDVSFNTFQGNILAVALVDTKVEARISHNNFDGSGVFTRNTVVPDPPETRIFVFRNVFRLSIGNLGIWMGGRFDDNLGQISQQSRPVIVDNEFELDDARGIVSVGVSDGIISGNAFRGINKFFPAVSIDEGGQESNISCANFGAQPWRWYIGNNDFSEFNATNGSDIGFGCVRQMLVGPEQNAIVDIWPFSPTDNIFLKFWPGLF